MFKIFFLSVFFSSLLSGNDNGIAINANFIEVDNLGNIYAVTDFEIYKFDKNLFLQKTYSQSSFGKIYSLDVSNPFKILVFFKDFNSIFFLDNNLSEISKIDFSISDFTDIQLVSSSLQSDFWIYDNSDKRIFLINEKFEIQQKSKFLGKYICNNEFLDMVESENKLYLGIKYKGVLIFDINAKFNDFVELNRIEFFSVFSEVGFLFCFSDQVFVNQFENNENYQTDYIFNLKDYKLNNSKKIILTKDSLIIKLM